jgi:hypothetical protein
MGIVGLLAQGARAYARSRSRQVFRQTYDELTAVETPPLISTTAPVHQLLVEELRSALVGALPSGWAVTDTDDLIAVTSPQGPQLLVEVEAPGVSTLRGRSEGHAVPAYWVVSPVVPMITVLALEDGAYAEQARVRGEVFAATDPFAVTIPLQAR